MNEDGQEAGLRPAPTVSGRPLQPIPAPVASADVLCGTTSSATPDSASDLEEASQRLADKQLRDELATDGFSGPKYSRFEEELALYGISVLQRWMSSGRVFMFTSNRGFSIHPTDAEREELSRDSDIRQGLANITVAIALRRFRDRALVGGEWRPDGGASLATFFMNYCLSVFPNEFRRYRAQRKDLPLSGKHHLAITIQETDYGSDPAALVTSKVDTLNQLKRLDQRSQAIAALAMDDYSQEEIAALLEEPSSRAVEGVLYRLRTRHKGLKRGGDR
jgi:hypothetical protein